VTAVPPATWPAGFAIHEREVTADPELVEALRGVSTTIVSDCLGGRVGAVGLEPFHGDRSLGSAASRSPCASLQATT